MAGLSGLLDLGAGALLAQTAGVNAVGRNVANVNTEGYSRESVNLRAQPGTPGGVVAGGMIRSQDLLLAARERQADGTRSFAQDFSARLSTLEGTMTANGASMVDAIAALFGGILDLASAPTDQALRSKVVGLAGDVASSFQDASRTISDAISESNANIAAHASEATNLAAEMAALNKDATIDTDPMVADRRDQVARKLSELVGGRARIDRDGKMRFVLESGAVLVDGERSAQLRAVSDPTVPGAARVEVVDGNHRVDVTASMSSGRIAAQLDFRDNVALRSLQQVDQLAFDFATQMNSVHRVQETMDGSTGLDLFEQPQQAAGAASLFAVNPTIVSDPGNLAGRTAGAGQNDGSGFLALADLKDRSLAAGGTRTFVDEAINTYSAIGEEAAQAASDLSVAETRSEMLSSLRTSLSGVSIEEELAKLAQFQHAAEASAKFISTVDELMGSLTQM